MSEGFQKQLNQLKKRKLFFVLIILVVVAIIIWVLVTIFAIDKHAEIDKEIEKVRKPLEVNINEELLSKLSTKQLFSEEELSNFPIYRLRSTDKLNYAEFRTTGEIERNLNIDLTFSEFDSTSDTTSTDNTGVSDPVPDSISQPVE